MRKWLRPTIAITFGSLELTAGINTNGLDGAIVAAGGVSLNGIKNVHAFNELAKHNMVTVEMGSGNEGDEELGSVGVGTSISHGKETSLCVLVHEAFIIEAVAVDRFAATTVICSEITTLSHELRNNTVEAVTTVAEAFLSCAESAD